MREVLRASAAVVEAAMLLRATRGLLRVLPTPVIARIIRPLLRAQPPSATDQRILDSVVRAVCRANRLVPGASCLATATAGWLMLERRRVRATVRLGVPVRLGEDFEAHAWVECDGRPVLGFDGSTDVVPFPHST